MRKFLKVVMSLVLALGMMAEIQPVIASADESVVSVWDGTVDTSWYNETDTEFHIKTAEQLAGLAALTNQDKPITFTGKTIYLDVDVDLKDYNWVAISYDGSSSTTSSFSGTFDGQGHSINNLNSSSSTQKLGLFGTVHNATIKNINLYNATITAGSDSNRFEYGALISWASSSNVENCYASGKVEVATEVLIGGFIGVCTGDTRVIGCGASVDVISTYPAGDIGDPAPTVGGLVGQFQNAGENSLISDCYFNGSLSVTSNQAACGGLLGVCFDFNGEPGVTISNCVLSTTDITCGNPENITYIAAVDEDATINNCFWPDGDRIAVARLIADWDLGVAKPDPDFDQSICGESVADFTAPELLEKLNANASSGITWVQGKDGTPVFEWQDTLIAADYMAVDKAIEKVNALDSELYSNYDAVTIAVKAVDRNMSKAEQSKVDAMAQNIEDAIAALEYKDADYTKVDEAIAKAEALNKDKYKDFTSVEKAIAAVVRDKNITEQSEVDAMAKAIEDAINDLEFIPPTIISGNNSTWYTNSSDSLSFTSDAEYEDFLKVLVDDKEVAKESYTIKEGSTIVTLSNEFLKTLSVGKHTLSIVSNNGTATTTFTIEAVSITVPDTGNDSTNTYLFSLSAVLSLGVISAVLLKKRYSR